MTDHEALLVLNQIPQCNGHMVEKLIAVVGEARNIFKESALETIKKTGSFGARLVKAIREAERKYEYKQESERLTKEDITTISFFDEKYPENLKEIHDPPVLLYVKGDLAAHDVFCVSIVGSRNASFYGREIAETFAREFAEKGITVISGLAKGVDGAAHRGALQGEGRTVAVLGSGVDHIYPSEHEDLAKKVAESGALLSEYPLGTKPLRFNFPRRNRIISGMSRGTIIVEAAKRSGSLITARLALEEGREVYSIPGQAGSYRSEEPTI